MVYAGWLNIGSVEAINHARLQAYLRNLNPGFPFKGWSAGDQQLINALEDEPYRSPALDDAPWYDPAIPATNGFYGLYGLEFTGFSDSTREVDVTQGVNDGGYNGRSRNATRSVRVKALMLACDGLAMEEGMTWLRNALNPSECGMHGRGCGGADLCFYQSLPDVCERYQANYSGYVDYAVGTVTPDLSPLYLQFGRQLPAAGDCQPQRVGWFWDNSVAAEGLIASWGAMDSDLAIIYQVGPAPVYRVNRILNPSFFTGTATWQETGASTLTWQSSGGEDNGAYAQMGATGVLSPVAGLSGGGRRVAASVSLMSTSGASVTVRLRDTDSMAVLASTTVSPSAAWVRYSLPPTVANNFTMEITGTDVYGVDRVLVERSDVTLPYFDGNTEDANNYVNSWTGVVSGSTSTQVLDFSDTEANIVSRQDSNWLPFFSVTQAAAPGLYARAWQYASISVAEQLEPYSRHFHDVVALSGPTASGPDRTVLGGVIRPVEFILSAANPFAYSDTVDVDVDVESVGFFSDEAVNYSPNPSFETNVTTITAVPGTTGVAAVTQQANEPYAGSNVARCTWSTASTAAGGGLYQEIVLATAGISVGDYISAGFYRARSSINNRLQFSVEFRTDVGTVSTVSADQFQATSATNYTATDDLMLEDLEVPATCTRIRLRLLSVSGTGYANWSIASYLQIDGVMLNKGSALLPYFDGNTTDTDAYDYSWDGTTNLSTSRRIIHVNDPGAIVDPDCPPLPAPPAVPVIDNTCVEVLSDWLRHWVPISDDDGPVTTRWSTTDVIAAISTADSAFRQLRLRYYPDPFKYGPANIDPQTWCAEMIVSYLPANTTLTIDGITRRAWASVAGADPIPAQNLLYGSDGGPITWPELSCGIDWLLSIDTPMGEGNPLGTDVSVGIRVAKRG